jgi:hypothetical protein
MDGKIERTGQVFLQTQFYRSLFPIRWSVFQPQRVHNMAAHNARLKQASVMKTRGERMA